MTDRYFEKLRAKHPVVHCITNHVTSNDCANLLLACGAVPVMADCPEETAEISSKSSALVINLGTPRLESLAAMLAAGHEAVGLGHPVVFDPVGVGASAFRTDIAASILHDLPLTAIRGNKREITFLAGLASNLTLTANQITNYRVKMPTPAVAPDDTGIASADALARTLECIVIMSGETDYITDGKSSRYVKNGDPILRQITGAGCMLSTLVGAFLAAVTPDDPSEISEAAYLDACATAVGAMGLAGEIAAARMSPEDGNASCRNYLIDALYRMDDRQLSERIQISDKPE